MGANVPAVDAQEIAVPTPILRGHWHGIASFDDLVSFFAKPPNPDKHFAVLPGISHASLQQKTFAASLPREFRGWRDPAMFCKLAAAVAILAGAFAPLTQVASGAQRLRHHGATRHAPAAAQPQSQIACTVLGCMPIPAACTPVAGKTPGGRPTGYDAIVCPVGTWPLR